MSQGPPRPPSKPSRKGSDSRASRRPRGGTDHRRPGAVSAFDEELLSDVLTQDVLPGDVLLELEPFPARVRAYLSAAVVLVGDDPDEALRYALEAKKMASRSAAVREGVGVSAYHAGRYDLAARELRAAARISGTDELLPLIADCERGLGRPEKALELAARPVSLDRAGRVELRIVAAGARIDLGQADEAVLMLQGPLLTGDEASAPSSRLKYAYAEALLACGREADAREWFLKAAAVDPDAESDAVERALALDADGGTQRIGGVGDAQ